MCGAGISSVSQRETAMAVSKSSKRLVQRYGSRKAITCNNQAEVMKCSDGSRIRPSKRGPDTSIV